MENLEGFSPGQEQRQLRNVDCGRNSLLQGEPGIFIQVTYSILFFFIRFFLEF